MDISLEKFLKNKLRLIFLAFTVIIFCLLMAVFPNPAQAKVWHERDGNVEDVNPQLAGP